MKKQLFKKSISLFLISTICLSLSSCGFTKSSNSNNKNTNSNKETLSNSKESENTETETADTTSPSESNDIENVGDAEESALFNDFCDEVFAYEVQLDTLTLHYSLKDP